MYGGFLQYQYWLYTDILAPGFPREHHISRFAWLVRQNFHRYHDLEMPSEYASPVDYTAIGGPAQFHFGLYQRQIAYIRNNFCCSNIGEGAPPEIYNHLYPNLDLYEYDPDAYDDGTDSDSDGSENSDGSSDSDENDQRPKRKRRKSKKANTSNSTHGNNDPEDNPDNDGPGDNNTGGGAATEPAHDSRQDDAPRQESPENPENPYSPCTNSRRSSQFQQQYYCFFSQS